MSMHSSSYARLPERFFARVDPTPVADPRLLRFNHELAAEIGLDVAGRDHAALAALFSGNARFAGTEAIAAVYAGHQFGHFVPQLGDGRALLLGEAWGRDGMRRDIQLKGSGRTPYSRGGDGRAALGPVLREYLVSEAMHALCIPTTRALAAVATGESVFREETLPGAILTRVAASHVRVGTFQYFAARGDTDGVRLLADYVIDRHYPQASSDERPYLALLRAVIEAQASLVAAWMHVGFIHGVMKTDNMAVSGETIDFGPCAFMDSYDPARYSAPSIARAVMPMAISRMPPPGISPDSRRLCCRSSTRTRSGRWHWPRKAWRCSPPALRISGWRACAANSACPRRRTEIRRWPRNCWMPCIAITPTSP